MTEDDLKVQQRKKLMILPLTCLKISNNWFTSTQSTLTNSLHTLKLYLMQADKYNTIISNSISEVSRAWASHHCSVATFIHQTVGNFHHWMNLLEIGYYEMKRKEFRSLLVLGLELGLGCPHQNWWTYWYGYSYSRHSLSLIQTMTVSMLTFTKIKLNIKNWQKDVRTKDVMFLITLRWRQNQPFHFYMKNEK